MAKIVTLKNTNDEEVYPVTTAEAVNGGLYADNGTEVTGVVPDVTTSRIEDGAVTSDKIDWATLAPYWKVVSVVDGTNAWTIPAGYRFYRLMMRCYTSAPSTVARVAIASSSKSGTAWSTWVAEDSSTATAGSGNWANDVATLTVVTPIANTTACAPVVKIDLTRLAPGGTGFVGTWTCSGSGFDWMSVGKLEFSTSSGSSDFYLYFTRGGGSTFSNFIGYVEALVES